MTVRNAPKEHEYCGLKIYYRPIAKNGWIDKINFSFRERRSEKGNRQMLEYGKVIVSRDYKPVTEETLSVNIELPVEVVEATLDKHISTFFPLLIEKCENFSFSTTCWKLAGPYFLWRYQSMVKLADSTTKRQKEDMEKMTNLWGERTTVEIIPQNCADDLLNMDKTTAERCIALLRHVFSAATSELAANQSAWDSYKMVGRKNPYNAQRRINKILNAPVLTNDQCIEIVKICQLHMQEDPRYIAALLIMLNGIALEEICALQIKDIKISKTYPECCVLEIKKIVEVQGERRLTRKERRRAERRSVRVLEGTYQRRCLPVGRLLVRQLVDIVRNADEDDYLLSDMRNTERRLSPERLAQWLNETFCNIVETTTKNTRVAECLAATAYVNLRRYGLRYEELRYIQGLAPQHMDAQHYVDFAAPGEQSAIIQTQDAWICAIGRSCLANCSGSTGTRRIAVGREGYYTRAVLTIKLQSKNYIKISSHFGHSCRIEIDP